MIIPISHESSKVRRLPWVSFFIMGLCLVIHIVISVQITNTAEELEKTAKEYVNYYIQHPYLKIDTETKKLLFGDRAKEDIDKLLGVYRRKRTRQIHLFQVEEQEKLDQLAQKLKDTIEDVPYRKYGYIPAKKNWMGLLTYMFIHGGWLHLIGNLLLLYLTGPFIEDVWGRPFFTVFYIIAGIFSGFMFSLYSPNFTGPLIGASGAIAGLMGVFLIRYWKTKIKFWFFFFLIHGTFKAPAWLMLPIWLALEIFSANRIDSVNPDGGGVAHWAHIWGFLFGVVVAALMKRFKIEETYIHPKIDAQVHFVDEGYKAFEDAKVKVDEGKAEEAYALLLAAARKNPMNRDVVESLWNQGKELGKEKEAQEFFIRLIESEIRRDQMDVAFVHFTELRGKAPEASISMTCKFMLMKYLTERQDYKEAKELTKELVKEIDLNSSPVLVQDFARSATEHSPEVAKKVTEMCLQHPGISDFQKDALRTKLKELENRIQASPAESDIGRAETGTGGMGQEAAGPEVQPFGGGSGRPGIEAESPPAANSDVQPLADSVNQTREELIGQLDVNPESDRPVVSDLQYKTTPEGQPGAGDESQPETEPDKQPGSEPVVQPLGESIGKAEVETEIKPEIEPQGEAPAKPESQPGIKPEGQAADVPDVQPEVKPEGRPGVEPESPFQVDSEVRPLADSVGQTKEELMGQVRVNPESEPAVVSDMQYKTTPEGQPAAGDESQPETEPESQSGSEPAVQPLGESIGEAEEVPEKPGVESQAEPLVEPEGQISPAPESQPVAEPESQPEINPDEPGKTPSPDQSIMAINATPLNVKDGKIDLEMDQIGQQLLPLSEVKFIAVVEIAKNQESPYLLIDLFLDDPKSNDSQVRTIRLLSKSFDATKFSPGVQDHQDALRVFVSVLLKLSGATAYPDEDSILLDSPQSFSSIEEYEKSILS